MKQSDPFPQSYLELPEKEHPKLKYNGRDSQTDPQLEETERIGRVLYRSRFNFDCSDLRIFFKHRINNSRSSNDSYTGRAHLKKKSNETSSSSREGTLKRLSSKEFSNFEELCENTSIITTPLESKPHSKKVSNEIYRPSNFTEEAASPWHDYLPKYHIYKDVATKRLKGVSLSGVIVASKDDKQEQDIMGTISKLGLSGEGEEQKGDMAIRKNLRLPKNTFKVEVIERIKAKSLHHRHSSMVNNASDYQNKEFDIENYGKSTEKDICDNQRLIDENRVAEKKLKLRNLEKALDEYSENSDSSLFKPFESELSIHTSPLENPAQKKGEMNFFISERQDIMKEATQVSKKPHNLSTIATEHTIDGDNIATSNFNFHNNSFLTLLSATSNSFNNSGKPDFNSPLQTESEKITEISQPNSKANTPSISTDKSVPSSAHKDNANAGDWNEEMAEHSDSLAHEDYSNANVITNQGIQKRNFSNQNLSHVTFSHTVHTTRNINNSKQNFNQNTFHNAYNTNRQDRRAHNFTKENSSASKSNKKTQDQRDNAFFIIEPDQIEADSRTTLMVKNIPNKYDLPLLLQTIEKNHKGKYDFLYLPIDPRNKCNVGYAFINFQDPKYIRNFYNEFNGRKWEKFNSEKICEIKYARIQGRKALMHHFQYSNIMSQQDQKLKPHIPGEFDSFNNKNLKDLVYKQKLESAADNL